VGGETNLEVMEKRMLIYSLEMPPAFCEFPNILWSLVVIMTRLND
jgi:hypothetical protein